MLAAKKAALLIICMGEMSPVYEVLTLAGYCIFCLSDGEGEGRDDDLLEPFPND